jgi:hypothetical protein
MSEVDAISVASLLLGELVENVHRHAYESSADNPGHALVGAILFDKSYKPDPSNFRACLEPFAKSVHAMNIPVTRIIVADSGRGIPKVLGGYFRPENIQEIPKIDSLTIAQQILFWSLTKWSTSDRAALNERRGTRGLWVVRRFVRAYEGAITIRSEDALVGYTYLDKESNIYDTKLRSVPGTLVDILMLTGRKTGPAERLTDIGSFNSYPDQEFGFLRLKSSDGVNDSKTKELRRLLSKAVSPKRYCVVATVETDVRKGRGAEHILTDIISAVAGYPNGGALALVFINNNLESISSSVNSILEDRERKADKNKGYFGIDSINAPLQLIDGMGKELWLGENILTTEILNKLSGTPTRALTLSEVTRLCKTSADEDYIRHWVRDQNDILHVTKGAVGLAFHPKEIYRALANNFGHTLCNAIKNKPEGVYRTPSLGYVNRWIDVEAIVADEIGIGRLGFVLARHIESLVGAIDTSSLLVEVDNASSNIATSLAASLGLKETEPRQLTAGSLDAYGQYGVPPFPSDKNVILFADLIQSGNSVRRALVELQRWEITPKAIVCVFDAREKKLPMRDIPLACISALNLGVVPPKNAAAIVNIDPVLRSVAHKSNNPYWNDFIISPSELLEQCAKDPKLLHLCHIERREINRHFTIYFNAKRFFRRNRGTVMRAFKGIITTWLERESEKQGSFVRNTEIWFPGRAPAYSSEIANDLCRELMESGHPLLSAINVRGIPRAACSGAWVFPQQLEPFNNPTRVIAVDWGSLTAKTIEQLMRLAADAGCKGFLAVVFVSQMSDQELSALRRIRAIAATDYQFSKVSQNEFSFSDKPQQRTFTEIPAEISFISAIGIPYFQASQCPLCKIREVYQEEVEVCPTAFLKSHAESAIERLQEHKRDDVLDGRDEAPEIPLTDLYSVPFTGGEIAKLIELRNLLDSALRATDARQEVKTRLEAITNQPASESFNLLRLLVSEPDWLKQPPLCFEEMRGLVSKIALNCCVRGDLDIPDHLRQQAVIVLRAASNDTLMNNFAGLFGEFYKSTPVAAELLYSAFRYLKRPYFRRHAAIIRVLQTNLTECLSYIDGKLTPPQQADYTETIHVLLRTADVHLTRASMRSTDLQHIWFRVRKDYRYDLQPHHSRCERSNWINSQFNLPPTCPIPNAESWWRIVGALQDCLDTLSESMFPYLDILSPIILSETYRGEMHSQAQTFLRQLSNIIEPFASDRLLYLFTEFARTPSAFSGDKRREAEELWRLWFGILLDAGNMSMVPPVRPCLMVRIFMNCPSNLGAVIEKAKSGDMRIECKELEIVVDNGSLNIEIFCDFELLVDIVRHLFQNAFESKHRVDNAGTQKITIWIECSRNESDTGEVKVAFENNFTKLTPVGKRYFVMNRRLAAFGGKLERGSCRRDGSTYSATLTIKKWNL